MAELITMGSHQDQEFSKTQGGFGHFYRQQAKPITIEMLKNNYGKEDKISCFRGHRFMILLLRIIPRLQEE